MLDPDVKAMSEDQLANSLANVFADVHQNVWLFLPIYPLLLKVVHFISFILDGPKTLEQLERHYPGTSESGFIFPTNY